MNIKNIPTSLFLSVTLGAAVIIGGVRGWLQPEASVMYLFAPLLALAWIGYEVYSIRSHKKTLE